MQHQWRHELDTFSANVIAARRIGVTSELIIKDAGYVVYMAFHAQFTVHHNSQVNQKHYWRESLSEVFYTTW